MLSHSEAPDAAAEFIVKGMVEKVASRQGTCSTYQAFWNTNTNTLYQCTATNTWKLYYTPYTYPHPLTQTAAGAVTGMTWTGVVWQ